MNETTVVLTSCGRQDLLVRTLETFFQFNTAPIERVIIIEDGSDERNKTLKEKYSSDLFLWLATGQRLGQIHAIDRAYQYVRTPYVFHCEDDWEFYASGFIELSALVLQENPAWLQVYLRALTDIYGHPLEDEERSAGAARYRVLKHNWDAEFYGLWHGFAFNPGLRRLADYTRIGSYAACATFDPEAPWEAERTISERYKQLGFWATILTNNDAAGFVRHTGDDRHVGPDVGTG
jgi:hypothetical protein